MNVRTPLNKVFGFQGSNFLVVGFVSQFLSNGFQLGNSFGNTKLETKSTYVFVFN